MKKITAHECDLILDITGEGLTPLPVGTSSSAEAKSAAAKTLDNRSVAIRKVHVAPKTGSVSRTTAKSAVKKAILSRSKNSGKK